MTQMNRPDDEIDENMATETDDAERQSNAERQPRLLVRALGLVLVIVSVVLATYLVVAFFAYESGRAEAVRQAATTRQEQISRQLELAEQDLAGGNSGMALTRVEYVLSLDPENERALALQTEGQTIQATQTDLQPTAEPVEVEEPVEEPGDATEIEPLPELQTIRRLTAAERWEEALPLLVSFRQMHPDYERQQTDELLYDTLVNLGLNYVNTEKIELGLNYFSQAERLGSLPQEALDYRLWADLYLQGIAYVGVNYEIAAGYFRDLCAAAPFFQSSCARLHEALVGYGDQLAYNLDWCPAASVYQEAWRQRTTDALDSKLAQAREGCASATAVPLTGTLPLTQSGSLSSTVPITPPEPGE